MKKNIPHKADLLLCLGHLEKSDDDDGAAFECSEEWINLIDRGGLCHVSNDTYELFLALEKELRKLISPYQLLAMDEEMKLKLQQSASVEFIWYIISADWQDDSSAYLLKSIVDMWITIRGFSLTGAWMERYKVANKMTTQKSKGLRKQLCK